VQVVTDARNWGGWAGWKLAESESGGKFAKGAAMVDGHGDCTIAMPLVVSALAEQTELIKNRRPPSFDMGRVLKIRLPTAPQDGR